MRLSHPTSILACLFGFGLLGGSVTFAQKFDSPSDPQSNVVLGVLEDLPGHYSGDPNFRGVRAIFQEIDGRWRAFPTKTENQQSLKLLTNSYPREVHWTIAFDGKYMGSLTTHVPSDFAWYSEIGLEKITSTGLIPTVGKRSAEFSGFMSTPVYRPLVAISKPNFKDPEDWKPAHLATEQIAVLRKAFRSTFPNASNCKDPYENVLRPWKYRNEDIVVGPVYSSAGRWLLAELSLQKYACDGPTDDGGPFKYQWYVVEPSGSVHHLGSDMWLVDAGDYGGDGHSEVLFAVDGYNLGGYRLYYANLSKSAEFLFSYH